MTRERIITEEEILKACQLLLARRSRRPTTLVLHPADWIGLRMRLRRSGHVLELGGDRVLLGPFELVVALDPECQRHHFGLLYGAHEGPPKPPGPGAGGPNP